MSTLQSDGLILPEQASTPANLPSAGSHKVYVGDDGLVYAVDSAGTAVRLNSPLSIGSGAQLVWRYAAGTTPPTTAATLQTAEGVATAVAAGHLCITGNGDIYKCTDASNQAALGWVLIATSISTANGANTVVQRDENGYVNRTVIYDDGITGNALEIVTLGTGFGVVPLSLAQATPAANFIEMNDLGAFDSDAVYRFLGGSAAANRNAQLTELFASIPTSAGASGTLWNDGGVIKKVP